MKVLFTSDTYLPTIGGLSNAIRDLSNYFEYKNISYRLVVPGPSIPGEKHIFRLPYFQDPFIKGKTGAIFLLAFFQIGWLVWKEKPTLIHTEESGGVGIASLFWGWVWRKKVIGTIHTDPEQVAKIHRVFRLIPCFKFWVKKYFEFFYNHCDLITTPGLSYSKSMAFKKDLVVVPNGIDIKKYSPLPKPPLSFLTKYQIPTGKRILLYVGRLDPDKNIDFLVNTFAKIKNDNLVLLIVGTGSLASYFEKISSRIPRVVVVNLHNHAEIPDFYKIADIFVTASKIEVLSLTALEAMASGLPLVAAKAGGMVDLCLDGINGFLFKPDDEQDFMKKINILLENRVQFEKMRKESRRLAESYELSHCLQQYVDLYQKL